MKPLKVLFLDDSKERWDVFNPIIDQVVVNCDVVWAKNVEECIAYLSTDIFDYIYLDHDLGDQVYVPSGPGTGYEVAKWIKDNVKYNPAQIVVHTLNPNGAQNMVKVLNEGNFNVVYIPFHVLLQELKKLTV